jgi:hypothetical protein
MLTHAESTVLWLSSVLQVRALLSFVGDFLTEGTPANLHITTLGHGYASYEHVDHNRTFCPLRQGISHLKFESEMNLSHIITEFSFGPHFPDITQPLDDSFEVAQHRKFY